MTWSNVPGGAYSLTARATDNRSAVTTSGPVSVTVSANNPPTVNLTSPSEGSVFGAGATVTLTATASDDGAVAKVNFYQGASLIASVASAPYTTSWINVAPGTYTITAQATDNTGLVTSSSPVHITVNANSPPSVALTTPASGASYRVPATVPLAASASDSDGTVAKVEFFQGASLIGLTTQPPYSATWTNPPAGS